MSFKGNYFSATWNRINPMLAVCNVLCNSIGHGTAAAFFYQASRKLRVMYAAKQPPKLLPRQVESLAIHRLRSGTKDEQSLVSYCVSLSVFLPVNTVIVDAVAAICWEICAFRSAFFLPSFYVSSFLLSFSSSHWTLSLSSLSFSPA